MSIDMHVHTTASDGTDAPEQVVALALQNGLTGIAVTDHDTFAGVGQAIAAGVKRGLEVIPGIELSAEDEETDLHILGYLPDMAAPRFLDKIALMRRQRRKRIEQMVERLNDIGLHLNLERVLAFAGAGAAGRPHLAAAMLEAGLVADIREAFEKYIGKGCPAYVPRHKITPAEAIKLILEAKGVPVLAHPGHKTSGAPDEIIPELVRAGLMGIEAGHPVHSPEMIEHYLAMGEKYALIITGGSDYHGLKRKKDHFLGLISAPDTVLAEMRERKGLSDYY